MQEQQFDIVIIGAGSAGCVLANRLSADPGLRVALLEAGGHDGHPWLHVPACHSKTLHDPRWNWCHKTEPVPDLHGRVLDWPRGKVLGGSSSINGLLYLRGRRQDYDGWRALGNVGWSFDEVLPYFKRSQNQQRGEDEFHGTGGPLAVSDPRTHRDVCDAFILAAEEEGIRAVHDLNADEREGVAYVQLTAHRGRRSSTAVAFLDPVRRRTNLQVITDAHVQRLCFEAGRASSVEYYRDGRRWRARAAAQVVLSAGVIGSPQLLQLSGVGPARLLQDLGLAVQHALPGVGANLQDHLQIPSVYRCTRPAATSAIGHVLRRALVGLQYALTRSGPMSMGASQVAVFCRSRPALQTADIQLHFQPLSAHGPGAAGHRHATFTVSVSQLRPESRGHVHIKSPDPHAYPAIQPNYLSTPTDRHTAVDGIRMTRRLCGTLAMAPFVEHELLPGPEAVTDEALLEAARGLARSLHHPAGSCRMGRDPQAVVDARLRVHGVRGLRVVDASIMPAIPSGNTNAATIMVAEKAADMILQDLRQG
jgi:choline dehydrogenase